MTDTDVAPEEEEAAANTIDDAVTAGAAPSYQSGAVLLSPTGEATIAPPPMPEFAAAALAGVEPVIPEGMEDLVGPIPEVVDVEARARAVLGAPLASDEEAPAEEPAPEAP